MAGFRAYFCSEAPTFVAERAPDWPSRTGCKAELRSRRYRGSGPYGIRTGVDDMECMLAARLHFSLGPLGNFAHLI